MGFHYFFTFIFTTYSRSIVCLRASKCGREAESRAPHVASAHTTKTHTPECYKHDNRHVLRANTAPLAARKLDETAYIITIIVLFCLVFFPRGRLLPPHALPVEVDDGRERRGEKAIMGAKGKGGGRKKEHKCRATDAIMCVRGRAAEHAAHLNEPDMLGEY